MYLFSPCNKNKYHNKNKNCVDLLYLTTKSFILWAGEITHDVTYLLDLQKMFVVVKQGSAG